MHPQLINNFAAAACCAFKDFGTSYGAHQHWASFQHWQLRTLLTRQQCDSLVQQVTDSGSKGYWCLAGNSVYPCRRGHPRLLVFPFLVVMNHGVRTNRQLHRLLPHKGLPGWEREVNGWQGLYRHETMTGSMAGIGLPQNKGPGLHVWLVGMLVTSFLLQKTHCIFFPCWFLWLCQTPPVPLCTWSMVHFAVGTWVWGLRGSFSIWKMLDVALLAQGFSMMLSSILVFASRCSGVESWCWGDPSNCHRLGAGIEMDGNISWKSLLFWDRSWLVVMLTMSSSHLELFVSRPTEDSPILMTAALLSTVCGSPSIHPSSRYQSFRSDLTLDVTLWMARAKRAWPRGYTCCTPVAESRLNSPWKRDVFEE